MNEQQQGRNDHSSVLTITTAVLGIAIIVAFTAVTTFPDPAQIDYTLQVGLVAFVATLILGVVAFVIKRILHGAPQEDSA